MMKVLKSWWKNARPTSLMQSMMPACLAVVLAFGQEGFSLPLALMAVLGVMMAHLGLNLTDDYFDYYENSAQSRQELKRQGIRARHVKYPYLTDGSATLKDLRIAIAVFFLVAVALGIVIWCYRSNLLLYIFLITLLLGVFYSAPPFKLSYRGLGEVVIGVIFGPLLMTGVYVSACGQFHPGIVYMSVPVGLLVLNILFTHSFIDQAADAASHKMTFARLLKSNTANLMASALINLLPYVIVVAGVVFGSLHWLYLLVLLAMPRSFWLLRSLLAFARNEAADTQHPPRFMGRMENWEAICASGTDWFMIRWYAARNTISAFCQLSIIAHIIYLICF